MRIRISKEDRLSKKLDGELHSEKFSVSILNRELYWELYNQLSWLLEGELDLQIVRSL